MKSLPLPSRSKQIEWLSSQLESGAEAEESLSKFAGRIVDSFHEMLTADLKDGTPPLHEGSVFKSPTSAKVHLVAWMDDSRAWVVTADSRYGIFGTLDSPFWRLTEHSRSNPDLLRKNPDWKPGDVVSRNQRLYRGRVLAVGNKCALLEDLNSGDVQPESNENLAKYYRKES